MKKEIWFGLTIMALVVLTAFILLPAPSQMANGHLGLLMLALVVVDSATRFVKISPLWQNFGRLLQYFVKF